MSNILSISNSTSNTTWQTWQSEQHMSLAFHFRDAPKFWNLFPYHLNKNVGLSFFHKCRSKQPEAALRTIYNYLSRFNSYISGQSLRRYASAAPTAAFAGQKGSNVSVLCMLLDLPKFHAYQGKYTVTLIPGDGTLWLNIYCRFFLWHVHDRHWSGN